LEGVFFSNMGYKSFSFLFTYKLYQHSCYDLYILNSFILVNFILCSDVFRLWLHICNLLLGICPPIKSLEGCTDPPWVTSSKAAFLSTYGRTLSRMLSNDYVLLEQEVISVVACPSLQEWYLVYLVVCPSFSPAVSIFQSYTHDIISSSPRNIPSFISFSWL